MILRLIARHVHELYRTRPHQMGNHRNLESDALVFRYENPVMVELVRNAALAKHDRNVIENIGLLRLSWRNGCRDNREDSIRCSAATVIVRSGIDLSVRWGGRGGNMHDVNVIRRLGEDGLL